jgi:hypothetical protein
MHPSSLILISPQRTQITQNNWSEIQIDETRAQDHEGHEGFEWLSSYNFVTFLFFVVHFLFCSGAILVARSCARHSVV